MSAAAAGASGATTITRPALSYAVADSFDAMLMPSLQMTGRYGDLNPATNGESFDQTINLTAEEFDAIRAELGGSLDPVTLPGDDPLFTSRPDNPLTPDIDEAAPQSALAEALQTITLTFESAEDVPDLYRYMDVNRDGNPDLVRYGRNERDDGLDNGDARYEITLLGPELTDLGLPTIKHQDLDTAAYIAQRAPELLAWAAGNPADLGIHGDDLASLFYAAQESGALEEINELRGLDAALLQDMVRAQDLMASEEPITDAQWAEFQESVQTDETTTTRRAELAESLGLFDTAGYEAANPGLRSEIATNIGLAPEAVMPAHLSHHYVKWGNLEERAVDAEGTVLDVGPGPIWPGLQSRGSDLIPGEVMRKDEMLVSENGQYIARFENDGDLEIHDVSSGEPVRLWAADTDFDDMKTTGDAEYRLEMQADGNLVIYNPLAEGREEGLPEFISTNPVTFATGTNAEGGLAHGAFRLELDNDGNLVVHDDIAGEKLWMGGAGENDNDGEGRFIRRADVAEAGDVPEGATDSANENREAILFTDEGARSYLASDVELVREWQARGGDDVAFARQHFQRVGQFEDVEMFTPYRYIAAPGNDDLALAFKGDPDGATKHFVLHGVAEYDSEGRRRNCVSTRAKTPTRPTRSTTTS